MLVRSICIAAIGVLALGGCVEEDMETSRPAVGSETNLNAFVGARAGQAEMGIRNLGYEPIRSQGLTTYWFNRSTGACAEIVTSDGRYSSVTMLPAGDC